MPVVNYGNKFSIVMTESFKENFTTLGLIALIHSKTKSFVKNWRHILIN